MQSAPSTGGVPPAVTDQLRNRPPFVGGGRLHFRPNGALWCRFRVSREFPPHGHQNAPGAVCGGILGILRTVAKATTAANLTARPAATNYRAADFVSGTRRSEFRTCSRADGARGRVWKIPLIPPQPLVGTPDHRHKDHCHPQPRSFQAFALITGSAPAVPQLLPRLCTFQAA